MSPVPVTRSNLKIQSKFSCLSACFSVRMSQPSFGSQAPNSRLQTSSHATLSPFKDTQQRGEQQTGLAMRDARRANCNEEANSTGTRNDNPPCTSISCANMCYYSLEMASIAPCATQSLSRVAASVSTSTPTRKNAKLNTILTTN